MDGVSDSGERSEVHSLERAAMSAWPALDTIEDAGWVVRCAGGYTRRANCATPLGDAADAEPDRRIAWCERELAVRGVPPVFRVLSRGGPVGVDRALEAAGYARADEALVMTLDLPHDAAVPASPALEELPVEPWLDLYDRFGGKAAASRATHRAMLDAIPGDRLLAAVVAGGRRAGCALAVRDGGLVGLFDVAVAPALRGRGHGRHLVNGLLSWGRARGARRAYLQVLATNEVAIRLYERTGFRETYRYWYRVRAGT